MTVFTQPWKWVRLSLLALAVGVLLYQIALFLMVLWYSVMPPRLTPFMAAEQRELRASEPDARIRYEWVPYDQISTNLKRAVIASEDANFMQHTGVEWDAIRKAWDYNRRQSEKGSARRRGGSTISQQLAKNLFLSESRSYLRKGQELILTYMIEAVMSKERILELYLNVAQWGQGVFGAQAAARHYYKQDAARISAVQAARLAGMLPNPAYYDRRRDSSYLQSRTRTISQRMRQAAIP
ncbi:monofunctional biosynthetic peptidoglycan transglycosylase [Alcaligenes sp. SDU_A2]|uniref:monofunctional biosynthetic peptidoglycan transglycosylase n=1 Tax=Alcaligenes sp. SDU_A2 TaxID=3136634 RepID=UPI002BDD48D7|nr:monofunctional biosynthetic peptidoglycan transglycosylase [Alcaligenes sp.]HRL28036.1 monofunctional biosynthetic peptidoglycan transglycosylase [Alcaligenes sp.]